ncbi:MAG TPA: 23S rRNA (pseudouridine(1915)-N(3))-methyltransferase RlmH [Xanthobacteraceae bacterium]|nr:23S rRNA (pseudouridine(1915)-N(3))-methyltransferase RlmH [Xanthobacteraceae bacterium]
MRLRIAAVGRLKAGPERELLDRYLERVNALGRGLNLAPLDAVEVSESSARRPADRMKEEAVALKKWSITGARRIVLDARGKSLSSEDFAKRLVALRENGAPAALFLIGGADGLAEEARKDADFVLAFGAATFPHQLVRILLAEQIYRALTILSGHPYHRA